ncbi:hypothetical protein BHM03_00051418 [Ensete ventricosum]|nr:hypothetical protein BHM03_00051418 [Ensete ventricosum]
MTTAHRRRGGLQITITTNVMVTTTRTLSKSMPPFPLSSAAQHTFPMAGDEERRTRETERESDGSENEAMFVICSSCSKCCPTRRLLLCAHDLFWTLHLSLRVQSREPVAPIEGPKLTTAASVETPKPSSGSSIGVSSLLQQL